MSNPYEARVRSHFDKLLAFGTANFGPDPAPMWLASLDTRTGRYPEDDTRPAHIPKRVYRNIDAPKGCSLYWDQPSLAAAAMLSQITGDGRYRAAAETYIGAFLQRCVARKNGLFLWGNHYYWDAFSGCVMKFKGAEPPQPADPETDAAELHETRPLAPHWELFWNVDRHATERCIRAMGQLHVYDDATGGFNRHADRVRDHAFLESGGILAEALAWLGQRTGDASLFEQALKVARFSFSQQHAVTRLLRNSPDHDRWDRHVLTNEVGLWADCVQRCAAYANAPEFRVMAASALERFLHYAWDDRRGLYFGMIAVADGAPVLEQRQTPFQPGDHARLWTPLFPAHDYPMSCAMACLHLYAVSGRDVFRIGVERWVQHLLNQPAPETGAYAEHYGRVILFLLEAGRALERPEWIALGSAYAQKACDVLFAHGMFRGHPGEDRYDAVDGVGFLLQALLAH